jgi:small subunit ribosomal protein S2e
MAEEASRGGFDGGFGGRGRGRGRGRGDRGRGGPRGRRGDGKQQWVPVTKLGRLVKAGKIVKLEEIFMFSIPIKEYQIVDHLLGESSLKDEVLKLAPVQKQTRAGQRNRFKAVVVVGDENGHVGLGVKCSKEVATSIRGAIIDAKMRITPIRRGYWGNKFGEPHTVPSKVTGKCGSVRFRLIPAPRGTGIVAARAAKKLLQFAGVKDVYTSSTGTTRTLGNFVKAAFACVSKTYAYLTPDDWTPTDFKNFVGPFQAHTDYLKSTAEEDKVKSKEAIKAAAMA